MSVREKLLEALSKPDPASEYDIGNPDYFDPWEDIISNIYGSYSSKSDDMFIIMLEAVRDRTQFEMIEKHGFSAELILYIFAGHGLTEYGGSPRSAWPDDSISDLWDGLIEKWKIYSKVAWSCEEND